MIINGIILAYILILPVTESQTLERLASINLVFTFALYNTILYIIDYLLIEWVSAVPSIWLTQTISYIAGYAALSIRVICKTFSIIINYFQTQSLKIVLIKQFKIQCR